MATVTRMPCLVSRGREVGKRQREEARRCKQTYWLGVYSRKVRDLRAVLERTESKTQVFPAGSDVASPGTVGTATCRSGMP